VFSVVGGVVVFVLAGHLMSGQSHCVDGWMSHSIGHRGACSHHGGVADNPLDLILGVAAGFLAYYAWGKLKSTWARRVDIGVAGIGVASAIGTNIATAALLVFAFAVPLLSIVLFEKLLGKGLY
jgi:hypothetical protein